jgi:AraC-like DNA-binding protein
MHTLRAKRPRKELSEYVRIYAQRNAHPNEPVLEPVPARLEPMLQFEFGNPLTVSFPDGRREKSPRTVMIGIYTRRPAIIAFEGYTESFGIFFRPGGLTALFGTPARVLTNRSFDWRDLFGSEAARLYDRLAGLSFDGRVAETETFLMWLAAAGRTVDPMLQMAEHLLERQGMVQTKMAAQWAGLGIRQFERRFEQSTGVAPKLFARVARFQTALDMKIAQPRKTWLRIAHDLCYHDQTHMVLDFKHLTGNSPTQIVSQIGDGRPQPLLEFQSAGDSAVITITPF